VFTQQKVKTPPPYVAYSTASEGTSVDAPQAPPQPQRPLQPPPPPPIKQKPQVPRKPQTKRVSFIEETNHEPEQYQLLSTNDMKTSPYLHERMHEDDVAKPIVDTNDACAGVSSLLIRNRPPKAELGISKPVPRASLVLPDDLIIPPPPSFNTDVSDNPTYREIIIPPITLIPGRAILPEPTEADTSIQSSTTTTTPETEVPPPVNYNAFPVLESQSIMDSRMRSAIVSEVPPHQVFRTQDYPSYSTEDFNEYFNELSGSPIGDPDPPELLHVQYKTLPIVSHIPHSPCNLHPDKTYFQDNFDESSLHNSLRDLRVKNISPGMVHSTTYPTINPYPSLTTVAGTYNPYTCTVPTNANRNSQNLTTQTSPSVVSTGKDINANVTQTIPSYADDVSKSVHSERRVRFGHVTTAPESGSLSDSSDLAREGSSSPASTPKPAWSSNIKSFAIGEVIINVRQSHKHSASFDCVRRQPNPITDNNT
jgi:hypothetical protein